MANPNKAKGTAWETAICRFLIANGFDARRKVQRGSHDEGDVEIRELPDVVVQAKNQGQLRLPEWMDATTDQGMAAAAPLAFLIMKRRGAAVEHAYVACTLAVFAELMNELADLRSADESREGEG